MKKIILISALFLFVFAGTTMAANLTTGSGEQVFGGVVAADVADPNGVLIGKLSKGVSGTFNFTTTAYAMITKHTSGSKAYGTSYDSTAIYFLEDFTLAVPSAVDSTSFSTWTSM